MANPPRDLFVDGDGQLIEDGDLVQSIEGGFKKIRVRYGKRGETDVLVFTVSRMFAPTTCETAHEWFLDREAFQKSYWRRAKLTGSSADVIITDDYESEIVLRSPRGRFAYAKIVYTPPIPTPKAGSKGYQRRQNQRWPKGR